MKIKISVALGILVLGSSVLALAAPPDSLSDVQVKRLAGLGRLWGAVGLFHPWLASDKIDWDQALVQAIPRVRAAGSAEQYQAAVNFLLSFLNDLASRAMLMGPKPAKAESESVAPAANLIPPTLKWLKEGLALISVPDLQSFSDPNKPSPLAEIAKTAAKAEALIFDLRSKKKADVSEDSETETYAYSENLQSCLLSFIQGEIPAPTTRYRMYVGHPGFGPSFNTFVNKMARPFRGGASRPYRLVLIVDEQMPVSMWLFLLGLQSSGTAYTIFEGERRPEAPPQLYKVSLSDNVVAQFRISDTVNPDGSMVLRPDKAIASSKRKAPGVDEALEWAIRAAEGKVRAVAKEKVAWIPPPIIQDKPYAEMGFPSEEYRMLGLFRFWNDIQYFSPYRDLMDNPWDGVLEEFIPKMAAAKDALDYHLCVSELVARIQDSHGTVTSQVLRGHFGTHSPPLAVKWIEGQTVVTQVFSEKAAEPLQISRGDIVLAVDGEDIAARIMRISRSFAASTSQSLQWKVQQRLLAGPEGSEVKIRVRQSDGRIGEYSLKRTMSFPRGQRTTPVFGVLREGYGYMDLERLRVSDVDKAFEAIRGTPAVIFDIRGYPQGAGGLIAQRVARQKATTAKFESPEVHGLALNRSVRHIFDQTIEPAGPWRYDGNVVVLINEEAVSQAEHACLCLEAAARPIFVGSPTAGANGIVDFLNFPGGIRASFTALGVQHGDGRQLQRVGIQPHIAVRPTIKGIRDGRDEVLEAAINYLKTAK